MSNNKKYYWLKLQKAFFSDKKVKKMRQIAGGEIYTIIYLKLLLESLENYGLIEFENICDSPTEELSLMIDETEDNIKACLVILEKLKLCEYNDNFISFYDIEKMVGASTTEADRVKTYREKQKLLKEQNCTDNDVRSYENRTQSEQQSYPEKEKEKETEKERKRERERKKSPPSSDFDLFSKHLVGVFTRLTAKTALDLCQLDGFRTFEKREELHELFENRHFDWEGCIKYAENECQKAQISKRWLEFLNILRLVLRDGADGIKKHLTAEEQAKKEELEKIKQAEMEELTKKQAEEERVEREKYRRIQLERDKQEAEKLGISLEEYQEQRRIEEDAYFRDLKAGLCN